MGEKAKHSIEAATHKYYFVAVISFVSLLAHIHTLFIRQLFDSLYHRASLTTLSADTTIVALWKNSQFPYKIVCFFIHSSFLFSEF